MSFTYTSIYTRTSGHLEGTRMPGGQVQGENHPGGLRQHHHSQLYQEGGRYKIGSDARSNPPIIPMDGGKSHSAALQTCTQKAQCASRQPLQERTNSSYRIITTSTSARQPVAVIGQTQDRPLRYLPECEDAHIYISDPGPRGLRSGLAVHQVGPFLRVCVPSDGHPTHAGKDSEDNLSNHSDCTPLATTELAHQPSGTFNSKTIQ